MTSEIENAIPLIELALAEDLGSNGDITARCFVPERHESLGRIVARQPLIVAGAEVAGFVFSKLHPMMEVEILKADGERVEAGETVLTARGATRAILTGERTSLNFLQRLCGIATLTRIYVDRATGSEGNPAVKVFDTRKTTPGWRRLEKAAVAAGGGTNHRMGLYDAAMVKDNHLVAQHGLGALQAGIAAVRGQFPDTKFVELEADRLDQVSDFLGLEGVDVILLDNMSLADLRQAVKLRDERAPGVLLEASGGITLETIAGVAATGVDAISVGALTHSVRSADLALDLENVSG